MLSVQLPDLLEKQLASCCKAVGLTKSAVVQAALETHLKKPPQSLAVGGGSKRATKDPFLALTGSGNRKFSTGAIMRMTRGDDWNQP